jgi:hypothetical protein
MTTENFFPGGLANSKYMSFAGWHDEAIILTCWLPTLLIINVDVAIIILC